MCAVGELLKKLKTSVAIDRDLIAWVDKMIAKKKYASRTHAIEYALQQLRENEGE
jgi:Arc/MetJ-type ribon-helix-helix transcriptional regulator